MIHEISIPADFKGLRLDVALAKLTDESRSIWQSRIKSGTVLVDGNRAKARFILTGGEKISASIEDNPVVRPGAPVVPDLDVVYEDDDLLVINKPAGLLVHPAQDLSASSVADFARLRTTDPDELRPGIVHRLDKDTSGLLVLAKTLEAKSYLQKLFKNHKVQKTYLALVLGRLNDNEAKIDLPIGRAQVLTKRGVRPGGKPAVTKYKVLEEYPGYSLVQAEPETGRTHQIRVHFQALGHPIAGDALYGERKKSLPLERHFLHASRLTFTAPNGTRLDLTSPLPEDLADVLSSLRNV